jgi:hypothetical protein
MFSDRRALASSLASQTRNCGFEMLRGVSVYGQDSYTWFVETIGRDRVARKPDLDDDGGNRETTPDDGERQTRFATVPRAEKTYIPGHLYSVYVNMAAVSHTGGSASSLHCNMVMFYVPRHSDAIKVWRLEPRGSNFGHEGLHVPSIYDGHAVDTLIASTIQRQTGQPVEIIQPTSGHGWVQDAFFATSGRCTDLAVLMTKLFIIGINVRAISLEGPYDASYMNMYRDNFEKQQLEEMLVLPFEALTTYVTSVMYT